MEKEQSMCQKTIEFHSVLRKKIGNKTYVAAGQGRVQQRKMETAPKWGLGGQLLGGMIGCKGGIPALEVLP